MAPAKGMSPVVRNPLIAGIVVVLVAILAYPIGGQYLTSLVLIFGSILVYLVLSLTLRSQAAADFYVAGRAIPAVVNGAATAADWMSAASYLSMAGIIAFLGFDALPYVIGWTLGYTLMAFTIAPFVRKSGTYTVPELIERLAGNWSTARVIAVLMVFITSLTYLTAQLVGVSVVFSRFLGIPATIAVFVGAFAAFANALTSGWRSITWVQFVQYWVLISMYLLPVLIAAAFLGLYPIPHLQYGPLMAQVEAREAAAGISPLWTEPLARPFAGGTGMLNWILSALVLMLGTMGLPHILVRFYTVTNVHAARVSVGWALLFIGLLYTTASIYAAIARLSISNLWNKPMDVVMNTPWIQKWLPTGLVNVNDANGDGIIQPAELSFHNDIVVVGMPDMFGMLWLISPLVAVGGLAAALSTADGLLLAMSTAISRDIYKRFINPQISEVGEVSFVRVMLIIIGFIGGVLGYLAIKDPTFSRYVALLVGWAFVFAASTFTPAIMLGIFWKRLNRYGIVAGMVVGMAVALPYVLAVGIFNAAPLVLFGQKIGTIAWGAISFLANALTAIVVSLLTPPEGKEREAFVDHMRMPD
ncbi:cation acetate symporter [Thermus antranikianii]